MSVSRRPTAERVTLEVVARVAGVSRATVSRVVNGKASVDEGLRQAVERAISETGYLPNLAARSLVTRRADAIALVLPEESRILGDPFFGRVVSGVTSVLNPLGLHLVLLMTGRDSREQVVTDLRQGRLDGVILIHTYAQDPLPGQLLKSRLPVVLAGKSPNPTRITYVDVDQVAGGALAAQHLHALVRHDFATITGPLEAPAGQGRLTGFRDTLIGLGHPPPLIAEGDFSRAGGAAAMERLLADTPGLDAVFVASDLMAQGALPVLRKHGRRVPEDVAVIGFDDSSAALACEPPLTTVRQPVEDMAAEMARQVLTRVEDPDVPPAAVIFEPTLVHRDSA
ncbi:LacI family DNA-binding transcriptional regulator [Crossiella cryophila]|uniref:DNA-binding LacI/PurR family transcriptional regulator n=1 Tax=Crossiella cryophila TaxID=43355 RepID=A0A7W7CBY7_9PSEU|nr:LacI family DNA-binding transcriptional regulator [Crossiella cryophila]MBB4678299.1 DNA-binding LacI/PurR family transcriptional regulator [Crossiella cryophila]